MKRDPISPYFDIKKDAEGRDYMEVYLEGIALLRLVLSNKGTAFTEDERVALGLDGLLPPQVNTLEQQVERVYRGFLREPDPIAKYQYLRALQERAETLFYALLEQHLEEMMPIIYTPTVGQAVQQFSHLYQNPRGLSFSPLNIDRADRVVRNFPWNDVRMIVATDSSAILGIGDQGYGGLAIVQAAYGAGNRVIDVTDRLRAQVSGNQLSVRAGNDLAGYDPAPGTPKVLWVTYSIGGREYQVSVRESETLRLP